MPFRRRRSFRRGPRRKTQWEWASLTLASDMDIGFPGEVGVVGGISQAWIRPPADVVDTSFVDTLRWQQDVTLVRFQAAFNARAGTIPAVGQGVYPFCLHMGVLVWPGSDDVIPNDFVDASDGSWDWIWRAQVPSIFIAFGGITNLNEYQAISHSKRKIDSGDGLLWCACVASTQPALQGVNVPDIGLDCEYRWLMQLP